MGIWELFTNINPDKIGRNLIILAFMGLLVISVSFSYGIVMPTIVPISLVLFILIILLMIYIKKNKISKPIPFKVFIIILLGYCCVELIIGLLSNDPKLALQEFAPFLFILFVPIFTYFYSTIKQIRVIIFIIFTTILIPPCIFWLFGAPLIYGKFMPIIALAFVPFLLYSTNKWNITLIAAGSIILLSAVFAMQTGSRGAWIALLGMIIFFIIISIFNVKEPYVLNTKKGIIYSALLLFIVFTSSMFFNPSIYPRIISMMNILTHKLTLYKTPDIKSVITQKPDLSFVANLEKKGFLHDEAIEIASIGGVSEQEITVMIDKLLNNFYNIVEIKDYIIIICNINNYNERQNFIQELIKIRRDPMHYGSKLFDTNVSIATNNATWRYVIWKDTLAEWFEKPFTGYGFGHAIYSKTLKELNWIGASRPQNPHNAYIHILYMLGLIGLILFIGFFISVFWYGIRNIQNSKHLEIKLLNISLLNSMIYILILSFVDPVIEYPQISIFLWLAIGLLIASSRLSLNATNSDTANEN